MKQFLKACKRRLIQLMFDYDFEVFEAFSAVSAMVWGFSMLISPGMFERSLAFATFASIMTQTELACVGFFFGLAQATFMFMDLRPWRRHFALAMFVWWLFLVIGLGMAPKTTGFYIYLLYAAFSLGNYVNLTLHHGRKQY